MVRIETVQDRSVEVKLNRDEYMLAIITGFNRAESHEESTPRNKTAVRSHSEGALGEMMVCKHFEVNFNNSITDEYQGDKDIILGDYLADVKVSTFEDPTLLAKKKLVEEGEAEIYINVMIEKSDVLPHRGRIVGYKTSDWLEENLTPRRHPRDINNYTLDWQENSTVEELEEKIGEIETSDEIVREPISSIIDHTDLNWVRYGKEN